jgi:hypothetical protein
VPFVDAGRSEPGPHRFAKLVRHVGEIDAQSSDAADSFRSECLP